MLESIAVALYDAIASIYDPWSRSVTEDVEFYVEEALRAGGPVVELAVGTGRIAVPIARAGVSVIGIDLSQGMLDVARTYAAEHGVSELVDLRLGDMCDPPVEGQVSLVTCPFRSILHLPGADQKLRALQAAKRLLTPGGRFVFDVFTPSREDIEETHGRWLEREPGIFERADWDDISQTLVLSVRGSEAHATMELHWLRAAAWRGLIAQAGLALEACYGWFDRRPYLGGEDSIWVCRRPLG